MFFPQRCGCRPVVDLTQLWSHCGDVAVIQHTLDVFTMYRMVMYQLFSIPLFLYFTLLISLGFKDGLLWFWAILQYQH